MSRCACGRIKTTHEMCRKDKDGNYEDLCTKCLQMAEVLGCEEESFIPDLDSEDELCH